MKNLSITDNTITEDKLEDYTSHTEPRFSRDKGDYKKKIWIKYRCKNCGSESHKHKSVPDGHRGPSPACIECGGKTLSQIQIAEAEIHE